MRRILPALLLALLAACAAAAAWSRPDPEAEARRFMEEYARDLLAGDREAIAGRYDRRGAYVLGNGRKRFEPWDSIAAGYRTGWSRPAGFEWRDLSYEVIGPDAVAVLGRFVWRPEQGGPMTLSYTGLLIRQDGVLRIRAEDESIDPRDLPPRCPPDSAR